jgi:hypothetical protein
LRSSLWPSLPHGSPPVLAHRACPKIERGRRLYAEAKWASDAVIAKLSNEEAALSSVQPDLKGTISSTAEFCDFVQKLLPENTEHEKPVIIKKPEGAGHDIAKNKDVSESGGLIKYLIEAIVKAIRDAISTVYSNHRSDDTLTRRSVRAELNAAKLRNFPEAIGQSTSQNLVQQQIAEATPGMVVFNPSSEMRVGVAEGITVRIARDVTEDIVKKGLQGSGSPKVEHIEVGTFMRARLFGECFEIKSQSDEAQAIPGGRFAEWRFVVWPLESGKKKLILSIALRFKLPNGDEIFDLPVLEREIAVHVNPWWSVNQFATNNWQWLLGGLGAIFMGVAGYLGKRWFERRYGPAKPETG